jgi:hypothetical protein
MLKEVRMSRTRLIASLTAISCCIAFAVILVVSTFPLKAAPRPGQNPPIGGVVGGVANGVAGGVASGVAKGVAQGVLGGVIDGVSGGVNGGTGGGVAGGVGGSSSRDIPTVENNSIWTDTVKRGRMVRQVRGLGTLVRAEDSAGLVARVALPVVQAADLKPNQSATVDTRLGIVKGHVRGINASASDGTRTVYVSLDGPLPEGAVADLPIDATIDIEKLDNILYVGRPVHGAANTSVSLFKIVKEGAEAVRVNVKLGRSSVNTIEVLDGLQSGDKIILSDMSAYDNADRIHLK